ncbi:MAG: hypothetical protein K8R53_15855 [Bacteroidales bacterium]|nr:hypothetical protein [Bacteroidales bacterium]
MAKNIILIVLIVQTCFTTTFSQDTDPYGIIDSLLAKSNRIQDYSADVRVIVHVDFLQIPPKDVKLYYKQPDKIKFHSEEFFILPKNNMGLEMTSLLEKEFTALYVGFDSIHKVPCNVIKIIPSKKESDIVLATLYTSLIKDEIVLAEITSKTYGTYSVEFFYGSRTKPLPSRIDILFEIGNFQLPTKLIGDREEAKKKTKRNLDGKGIVKLIFSNYKINQGLDDSIFGENEQ